MQAAESLVGTDPDISSLVLKERTRAEVGEPITDAIVHNPLIAPAADSFVGCDPDTAVAALEKRAHKIVHQTFFRGIARQATTSPAKCPFPFCPNPQCTFTVAKDVAYPNAGDS